jgi:hypothetical protein
MAHREGKLFRHFHFLTVRSFRELMQGFRLFPWLLFAGLQERLEAEAGAVDHLCDLRGSVVSFLRGLEYNVPGDPDRFACSWCVLLMLRLSLARGCRSFFLSDPPWWRVKKLESIALCV